MVWMASSSSKGRWKPLFKFSKASAVVPISNSGDSEAAGRSSPQRPSLKSPQPRPSLPKTPPMPHAWAPGPVVLNGSGRPGSVYTEDDIATPVLRCPWESEARPQALGGILARTTFPSERSVGRKVTFVKAFVTEFIEPRWTSEEVGDLSLQLRCSERKATGGALHAAALKAAADGAASDSSSGFGSDDEDEFEAVEDLAAKNARLNKEATRLSEPPHIGPRLGNVPRTPSAPAGARVLPIFSRHHAGPGDDAPPTPTHHQQVPVPMSPLAYLVNEPPRRSGGDDDQSSFASSSEEDPEPPPPKRPAAVASSPQMFANFVAAPKKLPAAAVADDASSFGSSSDGD